VQAFYLLEMFDKAPLHHLRQHGDAVLEAFSVPHQYLTRLQVNVLHAKAEALRKAKPRTIHQARHYPLVALQVTQNGAHFLARQHNRQTLGLSRPDYLSQLPEWLIQDVPIEEKESAQRLVLRRGAHVFIRCQIGQEGVDFRLAHLAWVPNVVKEDEPLNPVAVGLLGSRAMVPGAQRSA
jgi:hypothetical protein